VTTPADALLPAYDYVIVGGGSAGCVVARRLIDNTDATVLVIEAGPSDAGIAEIADPARWVSLMGGPYDWGYAYAPGPHLGGRVVPIPRGKVLGGSSSINAMLWYRGHPSDYDGWGDGWDFSSVLPYFKRAEDWEGGASEWRGAGGPLHIGRSKDPHPVAAALLQASDSLGVPVIDDPNGANNEGAALSNFNIGRDGKRWSTARGYLAPVSENPRLTVVTGSPVLRIGLAGTRAVSVTHLTNGRSRETRANVEVILAAGAIDTPRLMMLSGLGPAETLRSLGLPVVADLPGVGMNLQDHPLLMGVNFAATDPLGPVRDNGGGTMVNWKSDPGIAAPDLHAFIVQGPHAGAEVRAAWPLPEHVFAISPGLMGSKSRGFMQLTGPNPDDPVILQPNFLAEPDDLAALTTAVDFVIELAATPAYARLTTGPAAPSRRLGKKEREDFVRLSCSTFFHCCGTCAMDTGGTDANAVVDPMLRVRGVEGLRIVDASVIPTIPTCNTLAPVVMIAERAAEFIAEAA